MAHDASENGLGVTVDNSPVEYELTQHARDVLKERAIPLVWLEQTLEIPMQIDASINDPELESRFRKIPEFGDRVLRVIVNKQVVPLRVVSVYFDRSMKGKL